MTCADASALIALFSAADAHHRHAVERLDAADELCASVITVAEVSVGPARAGRAGEMLAHLSALGLTVIAVHPGDAPALAELRARTALLLPDCCVLLAARRASAHAIVSFDERLAAAARAEGFAA